MMYTNRDLSLLKAFIRFKFYFISLFFDILKVMIVIILKNFGLFLLVSDALHFRKVTQVQNCFSNKAVFKIYKF